MSTECIKLKESNCKNCYKCIRHCPVKAISFNSNQANIVQSECIMCGECFVTCPQNAKVIRNDLPTAKKLLRGDSPVFASIAPSFIANYSGYSFDSLCAALKDLGFAGVEETAIGATIVKNLYEDMLDSGEASVLISSCCHTVNLMIQRYYPGALPYLAKVQSPMLAHCAAIKREHPGAKTVFFGPCISKKAEADLYSGIADCVLTFEELDRWLEEEEITMSADTAPAQSGKAALFPLAGGILRSMNTYNSGYSYMVVDGIDNCIAALKDITSGSLKNCFVEMSACKGSCIGGPAMCTDTLPIRSYVTVDKYASREDIAVEMPKPELLQKNISFQAIHSPQPGKSSVEKVLRQMGKQKPSDELNCGSCGYNTCREKAAAILMGKADISMCLPYLMEKAQSFSDTIISNTPNGIIVLNQALEVQQINASACAIMNIKNPQEVLGRQVVCILDPSPFMEVVANHCNIYERRVYLAEYNRYIMLTVIQDNSFHIVISIMRDITETEIDRSRKEEQDRRTVEITDKVIEKQMRTVQEIASLLGETTAETQIALTKLKETLRNE